MKRSKRLISGLLAILGVAIVLSGCSGGEKTYSEKLAVTVGESRIYMDEMNYHLLLAKLQGDLYASYFGGQEAYWVMENEDGKTMAEASKELAMENAVKYELFYGLAVKEGYMLTQEDKEANIAKTSNIMMNIPREELEALELTEAKLNEIQNKIAIASRYYEDYLDKVGVNEDAVRAGINREDYQQYDIEYIYAQVAEYDELSLIYSNLEKREVEELSDLTEGSTLRSGKLSFVAGQDTFGEETNLESEILRMQPGEVRGMIETVKGYYIIKLIDNTSTKKYDAAVTAAIEKAVEEAFEPAYEQLKKEHRIKINQKVWKEIQLGNDTL